MESERCARQHPLAVSEAGALLVRLVVEAGGAEAAVASPAVGVDDRVRSDARDNERCERGGGRVGEQPQAEPSRAVAAHFDRDPDQRLAVALPAATQVGIAAAEEALVDLHLAGQRLELRGDDRPPRLVQRRPGRLVTRDPELSAQLQRGRSRVHACRRGRPPKTTGSAAGASGCITVPAVTDAWWPHDLHCHR